MAINEQAVNLRLMLLDVSEKLLIILPIITVLKWKELGTILAVIFSLVNMIVSDLLMNIVDPDTVHEQTWDEYLFVTIGTYIIISMVIFIYSLFIWFIDYFIFSPLIKPACKILLRKIKGFFD
ncbi:MAG: hypothetical protein Cpurp_14150 [Chlorogloea purpurea SAG 13.99]|jgi:hypothetical protein|nr:hypothetical protein [Chlorogloea purpurea SAG 13.99]